MELKDWLAGAQERLTVAGVESPRLEAELLATNILGAYRAWVLAHPSAEIDESVAEPLLVRREHREPLAYILGWREFFGHRFVVRPGVLIPRQETELLVETALSTGASHRARVLDLGTGSGCLAITLRLARPDWTVIASDVSEAAIEVAAENNRRLQGGAHLALMDAATGLGRASLDMIVCNPPYIGTGESLMPEVQNHEPALALRSGESGYEFYQRLAYEARRPLTWGGRLLAELGAGQAATVESIFAEAGWRHMGTSPDLGGIPRVAVFASPG